MRKISLFFRCHFQVLPTTPTSSHPVLSYSEADFLFVKLLKKREKKGEKEKKMCVL